MTCGAYVDLETGMQTWRTWIKDGWKSLSLKDGETGCYCGWDTRRDRTSLWHFDATKKVNQIKYKE